MRKKLNQLGYLGWIIGVSALILFGCSSLRHELFQSTAFDLGIFDQAVYLISQGQPPINPSCVLGDSRCEAPGESCDRTKTLRLRQIITER